MELVAAERPHAICLPMPAQGHINPMMRLASILHSKGFFITFVHTEFDRDRLLRSVGPAAVEGFENFQFAAIPDGLPPSDHNANRHVPSLVDSLRKTGLAAFRELLTKINRAGPQVTHIVWDGLLGFGRQAAAELGIADVMFWTASACGLMGYLYIPQLVEKGIAPLKDESCLSDGCLDTPVDWIPGMEDICLRDLPTLFRTTDPDDILLNLAKDVAESCTQASSIIMYTFEELERDVLAALASMLPRIYTIGPLYMLCKQMSNKSPSMSTPCNLWKEDTGCISWLDQRDPKTVVYVNLGSVISLSMENLIELAWGLASSEQYFLWIIRPDLVTGDIAVLTQDLVRETRGRCLVVGWCPQEQVLRHPSVGAFLTHCGWNSVLEAISNGVPMICWPFFAEQTTNCHYACKKWGIGMEIVDSMKRKGIEGVIRMVMEGGKGKDMRKRVMEWKEKAERATKERGSSFSNMEQLVDDDLLSSTSLPCIWEENSENLCCITEETH